MFFQWWSQLGRFGKRCRNSPEANGGWFRKQFLISDFVPNTASFRIRFISADIGDGSIVESAVDGLP